MRATGCPRLATDTRRGDTHSFPSCWGSKGDVRPADDLPCPVLRAQNPGPCWPPAKGARSPSLKRTPAPNPSPRRARTVMTPRASPMGGRLHGAAPGKPVSRQDPLGKAGRAAEAAAPKGDLTPAGPAGVMWGPCCPNSPQQKPPDTYTCTDTRKSLS